MSVETPSLFANAIQHHLQLKRRNADLEPALPLERYLVEDPFENHPLFKTEEQARLEETVDGEERFPIADAPSWHEDELVVTPVRRFRRRPLGSLPGLRLGRLRRGGTHGSPDEPPPFLARHGSLELASPVEQVDLRRRTRARGDRSLVGQR